MKKHSLALTLAIAVLAGCQAYPTGLAPQLTAAAPGAPTAARALEARVAFPAPRRLLATEADVKALATVSLMSTAGATLASGVTSASGAVTLTLGQDVNLVAGACYVLEAVKGLSANAAGKDAVRLRTIVQWTAEGWTSLTSATAGAPATIDKLTTAAAISVSLANTIDPTTLMGVVNPTDGTLTAPDRFTPQTDAGVLALAETVGAYVAGDLDPIATANGLAPTVTGLSATTGEVGTILTITGTGFNPLPGQTAVTIGGEAATVIAATSTHVYCVVPTLSAGASAVVVGGAAAGTFTVTLPAGPTLTGASLAEIYEGVTLTLTGTGFDTTAAANKVMFGTVAATPSSATATSLTVTVPAGFGTNVQVLVFGAKTNTMTVPAAPYITAALAITAANQDTGGIWATNSITRDLIGYPNGGTGAEGAKTVSGGSQTLPTGANFTSLVVEAANHYTNGSGTTLYVQGDLNLGANTRLGADAGTDIYGSVGYNGHNITLHVGGDLIMGANSAIQANGAFGSQEGGDGGSVTIYAHGYSLDPTAKIEAKGGTGANSNGSNGSVNLHRSTGNQPSALFAPAPTFSVIAPSSASAEAVSKAYDIGGSGHATLTYEGYVESATKPAGTGITYQFSDSADGTAWGAWTSDITALSKRYMRFMATMTTTTGTVTPTLTGLEIQYNYPVIE